MTLYIRPCTLLDCLGVAQDLLPDELTQLRRFGLPTDSEALALYAWQQHGQKWAVAQDTLGGQAVAIGGLIPQRRGVYASWMLLTPLALQPELTPLVSFELRQIVRTLGAHRVECVVDDTRSKAKAWYGKIGLKHEATLHKFCADGGDASVYVFDFREDE